MKRIIAIILAIIVITISISSCTPSGKSIMISKMFSFNNPLYILNDYASYTESLTYTNKEGNKYSYSIYITESDVKKDTYNICEQYPDVTLYAYNEHIYTKDATGLYSVILAFGTYSEYIFGYISTRETDFDKLTYYQKYSKEYSENGIKMIETGYSSPITPTLASKYSSLGLDIGNSVLVVYTLKNGSSIFENIKYFETDGKIQTEFLSREYKYNNYKEDKFSILSSLEETININIMYSPNSESETISTFKIAKGTKLGIDTGDKEIKFYLDIDCTIPFNHETFIPFDNAYIYGVYQ